MHASLPLSVLVLPALWLAGCESPTPDTTPAGRSVPEVVAGAPVAGMAAGILDLPVGTPMGGYSSRCSYLGGSSKVDQRKTPYTVGFVPSTGVHTPARAQVLWLENGDQHVLMARFDAIYSFDGLVDELEARLTEATGEDMAGKVIVTASHSHHQTGNYSAQEAFFLGGDRFDRQIFTRIVDDIEALALQAYDSREPAAIGIGMATDWDPDDHVYRDRREQNDELAFFEDIPDGKYKDPNLWLLRVDKASGEPLGFFFTFGMHGTTLGEDNSLLSRDSTGGIEAGVEELFDVPLVIGHLQGGGGDASPAGRDHDLARIESIGEYGAPAIYSLWESTPTSTEPIELEAVTRGISMARDEISVDREHGELVYAPYVDDEEYQPDNEVYDGDGNIITPIDEFNADNGGVFCGYDDPLLSSGTIGADVFPYDGCMDVELVSGLIFGIFGLDVEEMIMPIPHMMRAQASALRIGGVSLRTAEGEELVDEALMGFFPGETTSLYVEQFRRRTRAEVGFEHVLPVGYAQDHEGYLLLPEDWLVGGYEPNISFWGPLGAEHIMEELMAASAEQLGDGLHLPDQLYGDYPTTSYALEDLEKSPPDTTPTAGTVVEEIPENLWTPLQEHGLAAEPVPAPTLSRVQGVAQLVWEGGDPMVDSPLVILEREGDDGWEEIRTRSGRTVGSDRTDVLLSWVPDPLYPNDAVQTHTWWAGWQAVDWGGDARAGLETGTYRLHVYGERATGGDAWPYETEAYELTSDPFVVEPAEVSVVADSSLVRAAIEAPAWGWRLVDMQGDSRSANPLVEATLSWELSDGTLVDDEAVAVVSGGWSEFSAEAPDEAVAAVVTDAWGNSGRAALRTR